MAYWSRKRAAATISAEYFEVAERTLLKWTDVRLCYLNGRAHGLEADWRKAAAARLAAMLANQGAEDIAVLRLAKQGNAATAAIRARKRAAAEKLRAGKRKGKAEAVIVT
jgi:hypothetical protein